MATCPACKGEFDASFCPRDGSRLIKLERILGERYQLVRKVGEGSMGEVYEAMHVHLARRVAVKLLQRRIASDPDASARLRREAQSTTGLGHPNIVDTIDFGFTHDGQAYLVMEWLDGENLDARLARGPVAIDDALEIATQACAGVGAAHERGVIHRDLKPANLFLTRDHRGKLLVKVLDFGIAKLVLHETKLTATGVLIGTPNYMAPEQAEGRTIDARTDIYALGVILYEMLTGSVPFHGETALAVLHQHTARMPPVPSARAPERGINRALDDIVMRCLAKRPDDRFATMHDLAATLASARGSSPITPPPRADPEDEPPARPQRRWIAPAAIGILGVAGTAIAIALAARGSGHAQPSDAGRPDRIAIVTASTDASVDAPRVDAGDPGLRYALHGHHVEGTLVVRPAQPIAGQTIELAIDLGTLEPRFADAARAGTLSATVEVEYYKTDTRVAPPAIVPLDASGRFTVSAPIAHATKHHVHVDLLIDGKEVDHAKVDLWPDLR